MSTPNADSFARAQELLKKLWEQHKASIFERLDGLAQYSATALQLKPDERTEARSLAHKLAGSLGTFGFREGSDWARDSEMILAKDSIDAAEQAQLIENAENIRKLIGAPAKD